MRYEFLVAITTGNEVDDLVYTGCNRRRLYSRGLERKFQTMGCWRIGYSVLLYFTNQA